VDPMILLQWITFLLIVVIVMLSFLIHKVSEGINRICRQIDSIELQCNYEPKYSPFDDQMRPPED